MAFRARLKALIEQIPDYDERQVIELRYIHDLRWEEIAEMCGYSLRWVYYLHRRGICSFENILKEMGNGIQ